MWKNAGVEKTAWVVDYVDQTGKRHIKTFERKKDADNFQATAKLEVKAGIHAARQFEHYRRRSLANASAYRLYQCRT